MPSEHAEKSDKGTHKGTHKATPKKSRWKKGQLVTVRLELSDGVKSAFDQIDALRESGHQTPPSAAECCRILIRAGGLAILEHLQN